MARVVETVVSDYFDSIRWEIVITKKLDGAVRHAERSNKLGRPMPVPSIIINGELAFNSTLCLGPVLEFEALNPLEMFHVVGDEDEVVGQGASRKDQVEIVQWYACFFEIGFQHREDFCGFSTKSDDFDGILDALYLPYIACHPLRFIGAVIKLHKRDDADF
jgi:hypothetical protein